MELAGLAVLLIYFAVNAWISLTDGVSYVQRKSRDKRLAAPLISKGLIKDDVDFQALCFELGSYKLSNEEAEKLISQFLVQGKPFVNRIRLELEATAVKGHKSDFDQINKAHNPVEIADATVEKPDLHLEVGDSCTYGWWGVGQVKSLFTRGNEQFAMVYFDAHKRELEIAVNYEPFVKI